ncbi:hypothetical protein NEOLEDRAFT_1133961 [Neolentinus lepideus HHB14362 ss-1]|uniref:Uncharacterized protein n=1 Tax=Neolentinus lepideus HHB14362 ss-1 TaxID=1314782 RepID=A0A165SHR2_9AGAM|nr:hypothetical protein NEOLEDRAFT_1133961 [Neolentinus lepideus HHB14362 ss-1]
MLSSPYLDPIAIRDDNKHSAHDGHVFLRRQYTVEIVQLEEVPPPSPQSSSSSSPSESSSSYYDESDDDEDEESACTSYCSSDCPMGEDSPETNESAAGGYADDTFSIRMTRIHAWRETFTKEAVSGIAPLAPSQPVSWREDPDASGEEVKTSCSEPQRVYVQQKGRLSTFSLHSCPACDAPFDTPQSLRRHGRGPQADEACRIAVEYDFE